MPPPADRETTLSVAQLTERIKRSLEGGFNNLWVSGEISNYHRHTSGITYFTLKDTRAQISAILFASHARNLTFELKNGAAVRLLGDVTVYPPQGRYQISVRTIEPAGEGELMARFEELRRKIQEEGLFDRPKRPLPGLPLYIGIVTSASGAALRDILRILKRRFPDLDILVRHARVQGATAAADIATGIRELNLVGSPEDPAVGPKLPRREVIIVTRGGGSLEDLWPFNEEVVARAVAASHIPVVSAVGHETDHTICDFVADLRAPTPSAAAELVVPVRDEEILKIINGRNRMAQALDRRLEREKERLARLTEARVLKNPYEQLDRRRQDLDGQAAALHQALRGRLTAAEQRLSLLSGQLHALSPLRVLGRGYGLVASADTGKSIRSTALVKAGDRLDVTLIDGTMRCLVDQVMKLNAVERQITQLIERADGVVEEAFETDT